MDGEPPMMTNTFTFVPFAWIVAILAVVAFVEFFRKPERFEKSNFGCRIKRETKNL
jgi:hypothetical protein